MDNTVSWTGFGKSSVKHGGAQQLATGLFTGWLCPINPESVGYIPSGSKWAAIIFRENHLFKKIELFMIRSWQTPLFLLHREHENAEPAAATDLVSHTSDRLKRSTFDGGVVFPEQQTVTVHLQRPFLPLCFFVNVNKSAPIPREPGLNPESAIQTQWTPIL